MLVIGRTTRKMSMRRSGRGSDEDLQGLGYYSASSVSQRKWRNGLMVAVLTVIWYSTAVVTITSTKEIMNRMHFPFLLSSIQFVFAAVLSGLYLRLSKGSTEVPPNIKMLVMQIAASYTFGFVLTNSAFSRVTAAFAETIKSSEPISTVLIGLLFLSEGVSTRTYLTLLPICLGVGISCYNNDSFDLLGFAFAAASNICFSSRAVLAKKLHLTYPDSLDEISLFMNISLEGLVFLVPIMVIFEGRGIVAHMHYEPFEAGQSSITTLAGLLLVNGTMFAAYNLVSYLVLRRTDLITHSVLNAFRRVFIIMFTTYYFQNHISTFNYLGILIAVLGVLLFGYFRSSDKDNK